MQDLEGIARCPCSREIVFYLLFFDLKFYSIRFFSGQYFADTPKEVPRPLSNTALGTK